MPSTLSRRIRRPSTKGLDDRHHPAARARQRRRPHRTGRHPAGDAAQLHRLRDERDRRPRAARGPRRAQAGAPPRAVRDVRQRLPPRPQLRQVARASVAETMGNYHPHGDTSIYDTLVRLAQPWSLRYPLVDGQGNFGSPGNDPPAAMRYTEAGSRRWRWRCCATSTRRQSISPELRRQDAGTDRPARRFPNLLINGTGGIAVGMATNIPPHNLREVAEAVFWAWTTTRPTRRPRSRRVMERVKGPDFPTAGLIVGRTASRRPTPPAAARSGCAVSSRSRRTQGAAPPRHHRAAVPGQPGQPHHLDRRAGPRRQARGHLRDRRRVLRPRRHAHRRHAQARRRGQGRAEQPLQAHPAADQLRRQHALDRRRRAAHPAARPDDPATTSRHQIEVIVRRTRYRLRKAEERAHILRGLVKALDALDEVIALIRRVGDRRRRARRPDRAARRRRDPGPGDPRHAAASPGRARASEDHRRAGRDRARDRRPPGHPGQAGASAADRARRAQRDRREVRRRPPHPDRRRRRRRHRRGPDRPRRRRRHDHRDRLRQAHQDRPVPQPEARRQGRAGRRAQAGRHRQPLLRLLDARLDPVLHHTRAGSTGPRPTSCPRPTAPRAASTWPTCWRSSRTSASPRSSRSRATRTRRTWCWRPATVWSRSPS